MGAGGAIVELCSVWYASLLTPLPTWLGLGLGLVLVLVLGLGLDFSLIMICRQVTGFRERS